jgi:long-chain acyl-CoA synthetase
MTTVSPDMLALQRLYHFEKTAPTRIALTQPMGDGTSRDFTWAEVQTRRAAWLPNSRPKGGSPAPKWPSCPRTAPGG